MSHLDTLLRDKPPRPHAVAGQKRGSRRTFDKIVLGRGGHLHGFVRTDRPFACEHKGSLRSAHYRDYAAPRLFLFSFSYGSASSVAAELFSP